jgi:DNA-binding HxlR family transcriptional regulator
LFTGLGLTGQQDHTGYSRPRRVRRQTRLRAQNRGDRRTFAVTDQKQRHAGAGGVVRDSSQGGPGIVDVVGQARAKELAAGCAHASLVVPQGGDTAPRERRRQVAADGQRSPGRVAIAVDRPGARDDHRRGPDRLIRRRQQQRAGEVHPCRTEGHVPLPIGRACGTDGLCDSRHQARAVRHRQHDLVERVVLQTNPYAGLPVMGNGECFAALRAPGTDLGTAGHTQSGSANTPDDPIGLGDGLDVPHLAQRNRQVAVHTADLLSKAQSNVELVRADHKLCHRCPRSIVLTSKNNSVCESMSTMSSAELLLHPIRLRIIQTFLGDRRLTTSQLRLEIADVAPATLYRQVATLAQAGVLTVVDERRVRGTVERTYALSIADAQLSEDELSRITPDDHRRAFTAFLAGVLADVDRYIDSGDVDLERDGAGYRTVGLWLTTEELTEMVTEIAAAVQARAANGPGAGRTRRMLSTVLIPVPVPEGEPSSEVASEH